MKNIETIKKEHNQLVKAIKFLIDKVLDEKGDQKSGVRTGKPLVIHSLEPAFYLKNLGYNNEIVISTVLHDLLEDTDTSRDEIEKKFGKEIADIVEVVSYDFGVNKNTDYKKNFDKMSDFEEALIVKAADIKQNAKYFKFADRKEYDYLLGKWSYFLKFAHKISNEPVYKELERDIEKIIEKGK